MSGTDFYYGAQSNLAEKICEISNMSDDLMVYYGNSGAEAIEAALKLVRYHTKRSLVLSFWCISRAYNGSAIFIRQQDDP